MMIRRLVVLLCFCCSIKGYTQELKINPRKNNALTGSQFFASISDRTLSLKNREKLIFKEIKKGNIPFFLRKLKLMELSDTIEGDVYRLKFYVLPDYLSIGIDSDYCYVPTTPMLAQKIADFTKTLLPTKIMSDLIYQHATIKLGPQPIPPSNLMTTVPVFIQHNEMVQKQLVGFKKDSSFLIAGNKKDIIISNKIYGEPTSRVVIYGWHQLDGKAIQPVYNKHSNLWVDYSHGVRLVAGKAILNGKSINIKSLLKDKTLNKLFSDEGIIERAFYPTKY
jgi:hypothetical protein